MIYVKKILVPETCTRFCVHRKMPHLQNVSFLNDTFFFIFADDFCFFAARCSVHKAYRAMSRIVHPDQNDETSQATEKFQVLVKVHDFLMCEEKRKMYDETGKTSAPGAVIVSDEDYEKCKKEYQGELTNI